MVPPKQVDEKLSGSLLKLIYYKHLCSELRVILLTKKTQFYFLEHQSHPNFNLVTVILACGDILDPVIQVKINLCFQLKLFFHFLTKEIKKFKKIADPKAGRHPLHTDCGEVKISIAPQNS